MKSKTKKSILGIGCWLGLGLLAVSAAGARADTAASEWASTDQTQVRLLSAVTATGDAATLRLGLQFKLEPGWKIYWRSPGDAGLPPKPDWAGSRNLAGADIDWPVPERFELFGFDTFGYGDEVVLPIQARVERPGEPLALHLGLDYLVCEKICIPYQAVFRLKLPAGPATPSDYAPLIDRFRARVPGDGRESGLTIERASWNGGGAPAITVTAHATAPFEHPDVFVEGALTSGVGFGAPAVTLSDGGRRAVLRLPARTADANAAALSFAGAGVTLTLVDGARSVETTTALEAGLPSPLPMPIGFGAILAAALLGGLILNLMPCVLPVLSLKLLNLVSHAGLARARVRRNFLASAAGILAAFLILAVALAALKSAGATIGWGIQFQQPVFLIFMALVLTFFTANLWGWFELRLPGAVAAAALAASGTPQPAHEEGAGGAFLAGAFATLLATPCSAPFVGTAVGYALGRGPLDIVAIFLALGLGLALPYLAVAAVPGLAARLPRPGRWMVTLRRVLAFALAATALWVLSVLAAQIGIAAAVAAGAALLGILAVLWFSRAAEGMRRWPARAAVLGLVVVAALIPQRFFGVAMPPVATAGAVSSGPWRPFELADIEGLVRDGHVVFVDVTADWCLTCQVNQAAVVSRGPVAARLADGSVVPMRADWTRPNDTIAHYLASFGRYGIPFNVVYGPGAPSGIPLPELLSSEAVLAAFDRAQGRKTTAAVVPNP